MTAVPTELAAFITITVGCSVRVIINAEAGTKLQLLINKGGSVSGRFGLKMGLTNVAFVFLYIGLND